MLRFVSRETIFHRCGIFVEKKSFSHKLFIRPFIVYLKIKTGVKTPAA